eukprot:15451557-Alexandrium_andersonii.AAC.1
MNPSECPRPRSSGGGECSHERWPPQQRQPARGPEHSAGPPTNARACPARQVRRRPRRQPDAPKDEGARQLAA